MTVDPSLRTAVAAPSKQVDTNQFQECAQVAGTSSIAMKRVAWYGYYVDQGVRSLYAAAAPKEHVGCPLKMDRAVHDIVNLETEANKEFIGAVARKVHVWRREGTCLDPFLPNLESTPQIIWCLQSNVRQGCKVLGWVPATWLS